MKPRAQFIFLFFHQFLVFGTVNLLHERLHVGRTGGHILLVLANMIVRAHAFFHSSPGSWGGLVSPTRIENVQSTRTP